MWAVALALAVAPGSVVTPGSRSVVTSVVTSPKSASCPTFLLGDFDDVTDEPGGPEKILHRPSLRAEQEKVMADLPKVVARFVCSGSKCANVDDDALAQQYPPKAPTPPPPLDKGKTYALDADATDRFWRTYLAETGVAHATKAVVQHLETGCIPQACSAQMKACMGTQPCKRRMLRMDLEDDDDSAKSGLDKVYGDSGNRTTPLTWSELSGEEHGVFSCAMAKCAEPRLAVVAGQGGKNIFLKRLFPEQQAGYKRAAATGCPSMVPVFDLDAKLQTAKGQVYSGGVVMPLVEGSAASWAEAHSPAERAACAPALLQALTQSMACLHRHGLVHDDFDLKQVMYTYGGQ